MEGTLGALAIVAAALDELGIDHMVCGSIASTLHGEPRTTHDADLVADLTEDHVAGLVAALKGVFYCDRDMVLDAVRCRGSFNVVHLQSAQKVDIFVRRDRDFSRTELGRRARIEIGPGQRVAVATPEDTVLTKLEWYRKTDESSERQWRDALGVVKMQGPALDRKYMEEWAVRLGIRDLLDRLLAEAGR